MNLCKNISIGISVLAFGTGYAQFTPPTPSVSTVSVNSSNVLVAPTATQFLQANPEIFPTANIRTLTVGAGLSGNNYSVTNATTWSIDTAWLTNYINTIRPVNYAVFVSTSPHISYLSGEKIDFFPTDSELKVYNGEDMVYRATTLQDETFKSQSKSDLNAKIYFQCSGVMDDTTGGRRWYPLISNVFSSIAEQAKAMCNLSSEEPYPQIGNIVFQPNVGGTLVDGTAISEIWNSTNANLRPTTLLFNGLTYEQDSYGNNIWRIPAWTSSMPIINDNVNAFLPTQASDWSTSGTLPTFNDDGSFTFSSGGQNVRITQGGNPIPANTICIVSFEMQKIDSSASLSLYIANGNPYLSKFSAFISSGSVSQVGDVRIVFNPGNMEWTKVWCVFTLTSSERVLLYNVFTGTASCRNFSSYILN